MKNSPNQPLVAVVILNYNGKHYLDTFLPTLIQHSPEADIYVGDNNSSDDSIEFLRSQFPNVGIITSEENLGFAGGYNYVLKDLPHKYFAVINSDVEVTSDWLSPLIAHLEQNSHYVSVQPKILDFNYRDSFEYAGAAGGYIDKNGFPFCRGRIFDHLEKDDGQYDDVVDVDWTSGACMLIRNEAFWSVGGFDDDFFAHMEEIDLCWRLRNQGYKLACVPQSTVYHVGGGTLPRQSPRKTYLNFRNGLFLLVKNIPDDATFRIRRRILLDWLAALSFLIKPGPGHTLAVFKAHIHFLKSRSEMKKKRTATIKRYNVLFANVDILKEVFLYRKTSFKKILNKNL